MKVGTTDLFLNIHINFYGTIKVMMEMLNPYKG